MCVCVIVCVCVCVCVWLVGGADGGGVYSTSTSQIPVDLMKSFGSYMVHATHTNLLLNFLSKDRMLINFM